MTPPIFLLDEADDLLMFGSSTRACRFVEAIDVEAGRYALLYDATGTRLAFTVAWPTKRWRFFSMELVENSPVVIREREGVLSAREELRQLLARKVPGATAVMSLEECVNRARGSLKTR